MAIIIDMNTGEVLENSVVHKDAARMRDSEVHRPEIPQTDLQTYELDLEQHTNTMPEALINVDIDAFLTQIEQVTAQD